MNFKEVLLIFGLLACIFASYKCQGDPALEAKWTEFKSLSKKSYKVNEEKLRRKIFQRNLKFINEHNAAAQAGKETFTLAVNENADLVR